MAVMAGLPCLFSLQIWSYIFLSSPKTFTHRSLKLQLGCIFEEAGGAGGKADQNEKHLLATLCWSTGVVLPSYKNTTTGCVSGGVGSTTPVRAEPGEEIYAWRSEDLLPVSEFNKEILGLVGVNTAQTTPVFAASWRSQG